MAELRGAIADTQAKTQRRREVQFLSIKRMRRADSGPHGPPAPSDLPAKDRPQLDQAITEELTAYDTLQQASDRLREVYPKPESRPTKASGLLEKAEDILYYGPSQVAPQPPASVELHRAVDALTTELARSADLHNDPEALFDASRC